MSAFDQDGDSLMQSDSDKPSTPAAQTRSSQLQDLSPPNSQGVPLNMPTVASSASGANVNGKRPISSIEQAAEAQGGVPLPAAAAQPQASANGKVKTHAASGYTWVRPEDEPGYSWNNKKAQDDFNRAWDSLVDKNRRVDNKYGDPFAMADHELATMNTPR